MSTCNATLPKSGNLCARELGHADKHRDLAYLIRKRGRKKAYDSRQMARGLCINGCGRPIATATSDKRCSVCLEYRLERNYERHAAVRRTMWASMQARRDEDLLA